MKFQFSELSKKAIKINFNWAKLLYFLTFFTYGFYGVISKFNNEHYTFTTILLLILFYNFSIKTNFFNDQFEIKILDLFIFVFFFIFLITVNLKYINLSLFGDELAHTLRASRTSIYGLITIIEVFNIEIFDEIKFKTLVHLINFLLLIFLIILIFLIKNFNNIYTLILLIGLTIIFRIFLQDFGMHPPLDHIFSFIFFSIFGISDLTANLSYLFGYCIFQVYLFNQINNHLNDIKLSVLVVISIFTIPLLLSMSTWTESAIWSATFFIIILLETFSNGKINYLRLIAIISIATLFRVSIFITLLPVVIFYISQNFNKNIINTYFLKKNIFIFSPILLFIPFLFNSIFFGTPSFTGVNNEITQNSHLVQKLSLAIESNIIWITISNSISYLWVIFFIFLFFPIQKKKFTNLIIIIYLIFSLIVYYSIDQGLWGLAKYASEYALPLFIVGYINFIYFFKNRKVNKNFISTFVILIIFFNLFNFFTYIPKNKKQDLIIDNYRNEIKKYDSQLKLFNYKLVFNLQEAFEYIKKKNLSGNLYLIGTTYGFLPEIINNYTVKEILQTKKIIEQQRNIKVKSYDIVKKIASNKEIKHLLIADITNLEKKLINLKKNGWKIEKKFINSFFGSTLYLLTFHK